MIYHPYNRMIMRLSAISVVIFALFVLPLEAESSCSSPANAIEAENCLPGTPQSTWDIPSGDAGDLTIQGFATNISVNQGETINFKVKTPASAWHLDIYRMGYYGGNGARKIATVNPSVTLPQSQSACLSNSTTGLTDCGNWAVSASWAVPANAVSGIYFAKAIRTDTGGSSHIIFIVRNDTSHSDILFQTSDTSWQAYNDFSQDFYGCPGNDWNNACRAYKVSYNRPFYTRSLEPQTWVFNADYPMVRWLEANGYDITYFTDTDSDRNGSLILNHKLWMSNGHDEYWSGNQRTNAEAARAAGVNLAFFSGNSVYWETRWENSIDGSGTPNRTLVCYKETWANAVIDPADPPTWTGTWRDPRFSPPADGGRPENALAGTLTLVAGGFDGDMTVPQDDGRMRFWRNTGIAALSPGQTYTLVDGSLGEELDMDEDNGFRPSGLFHLSTTPITSGSCLLDYGTVTGTCNAIHNMTLYRHPSGALVFAAGTYDWAWGLDANHDRGSLGSVTDINMQQATVNLFADMGVQPATLKSGLIAAAASNDHTPPTSIITSPSSGTTFSLGSVISITGTATDTGGGVVGGVEVSTDSGITWHPATGRESWSYTWNATVSGSFSIKSRAVDDSGNLEIPSSGVNVTVGGGGGGNGGTIWSATAVPALIDSGPDTPVELGVKFTSDTSGFVTGIRFYKASANTGTHIGNLWSSSGTLLSTVTFTNETASGWQQMNFATPVAITAGTVYVASYHSTIGHYSDDLNYFAGKGMDNPPLHALADGVSGFDGVYAYGATSSFPNQGYNASNYWVDVAFSTSAPPPPTLTSIAVTPAASTISTGATQQFIATGTYSDNSTQNITGQATWASSSTTIATINSSGLATGVNPGSTTISATVGSVSGSTSLTVQATPLTITTASLPGGTLNVLYTATLAASGGTPPYTWSITGGALPTGLTLNSNTGVISGNPTVIGTFSFTVLAIDSVAQTTTKSLSITVASQANYTIWPSTTVPSLADGGPDSAVELGVKFKSDVNGYITGIRFYKSSANAGTHVGNLWTSGGTLLATAAFSNETASGWQQVSFSSPVAITANTVYVASYFCSAGHYSADQNYFATTGFDNAPLHALVNGVSGVNGVYTYGSASTFPSSGWNNSNYWVDVVLSATPPATLTSIAVTPTGQTITAGSTQQFTATGTYSDNSTQNITSQVTWTSSSTGVAAINSTGVATGVAAGTATISATLSSVTGSTTLTVVTPLTITTSSLPGATINTSYSVTLVANGGALPYTWSITNGSLPTGVSLNSSTGVISGTPTITGTYSFTVQAMDSGSLQQTKTKSLSIVVTATLSSIAITPLSPTITAGSTQQFTATGTYSDNSTQNITSQVTWASSATSVATITSSGLASGVSAGSATISAIVGSVSGSTSLTVQAAPLSITTSTLPGATVNSSYSATLVASSGILPYTWSITSGSLPAGITLNASTGVISGSPTATGTFSFTIQAADSGSPIQTVTKTLSITVANSVATIKLVQNASNITSSAQNLTTTLTSSVTAGDLIVVSVSAWPNLPASTPVTDTLGNTYSIAGSVLVSQGAYSAIYYAKNVKGGSNKVTFKTVASGGQISMAVAEFSGVDTVSPLDGTAGTVGSGTTPSSGAITPGLSGELIIGSGTHNGNTITAAGIGFTMIAIPTEDSNTHQPLAMEYQVLSGALPTSAVFSLANSLPWTQNGALFKHK